MSGWLTNGMGAQVLQLTGAERWPADTQLTQGALPETAALSVMKTAAAFLYLNSQLDKTMAAGSRYFTGHSVGSVTNTVITGVNVLIGGTGGTDKWLVELHDSTGALVATSATAGATVGTANTWQQFAFTSAYTAVPGTYYVAVQTNGTTAKLATYNAPSLAIVTGSATGTFGTGASITPPTTYTANLGPITTFY